MTNKCAPHKFLSTQIISPPSEDDTADQNFCLEKNNSVVLCCRTASFEIVLVANMFWVFMDVSFFFIFITTPEGHVRVHFDES